MCLLQMVVAAPPFSFQQCCENQRLREILYHACSRVGRVEDDAVVDSLDGLRDFAQNPEFLPGVGEF